MSATGTVLSALTTPDPVLPTAEPAHDLQPCSRHALAGMDRDTPIGRVGRSDA
jgi:hypothetical protein